MNDLKWNPGAPPKRGVYPVKSEGVSRNSGYRYWDGERWGPLTSSRAYAQQIKTGARKTPVMRPVLWGSKIHKPTLQEQMRAAYLAGFNASGEGWNGEIMQDKGKNPADDADWTHRRDENLADLESP